MHQACGDFLADPCGSRYQQSAAGAGNPLQGSPHVVNCSRVAGQFVREANPRLQDFVFAAQPFCFRCASDQMQEMLGFKRLLDKIDGALRDRGDGRVDIAMAGDHDDRHLGVQLLQFGQQFQAVQARAPQPDVEQNQGRTSFVDSGNGLVTVRGHPGCVPLVFQNTGYQIPNIGLVVDYQNI